MPDFKVRIPSVKMPKATLPKVTLPKAKLPSPKSVWGEEDRERITPATQAKVWKKRFGFRSTGVCVCCHQRTIRRDDFVCGHRRAYASGGSNEVSNLEPICHWCNNKMGTHDLVPWCKKIREELKVDKPKPKTATAKKTIRKTTTKKSKPKTATAKKTIRKTTTKKSSTKRAKR